MKTNEKLERMEKYAKLIGMKGFLFAQKEGPMVTIRFQEMSIRDALDVMIQGFHQVIGMELEYNKRGPKPYTPEEVEVRVQLAKGFNDMLGEAQKKLLALNKKNGRI